MKKNYEAWKINFEDFTELKNDSEKLHFLICFAILAPSGHNSQPWKFEVKDNGINVFVDFSRSLPKSDPNHRQVYISIGCAIENILIAADYYGFKGIVQYFPRKDEAHVARIYFEKSTTVKENDPHLIFSIPKRHTNRNKYNSQPVDGRFLHMINSLGRGDFRIDTITERHTMNKIADVAIEAGCAAMDNKGFREELSYYVKSNITSSPLGMPGFTLGIPTPVSLMAPKMVRYLNMSRLSRKQDDDLLKKFTPAFGVISTKEDTKEAWVKVGQLYERIALEAERNGVKIAPLAAIVQIREYYKDLKKILDMQFRPQAFFRMGYAEKVTAHSPRLSVEDVVK